MQIGGAQVVVVLVGLRRPRVDVIGVVQSDAKNDTANVPPAAERAYESAL